MIPRCSTNPSGATHGRVLTFGFLEMGWEDTQYEEIHPTIGWIPVESFDPGNWKPNWPNEAFNRRTPRDAYWGAKLVGSFSDEQIAAAVGAGRLPAAAAKALTDVLIRRRDKVVAHWYAQVTPIENVHVTPLRGSDSPILELSFEDLGLTAGVWEPEGTRYFWRLDDPASGTRASGDEAADRGERQGVSLPLRRLPGDAGSAEKGFATLQLVASRDGVTNRAATVYLRWDGHGYRVVGLEH